MVAVALFVGFVVGALVVIGVEIVGVLYVIRKLGEKPVKEEVKAVQSGSEELQFQIPNTQGSVWILDKEKIPKSSQSTDKNPRQEKRKIEAVEVTPARKHASINDKSLTITEPDGTHTQISLSGCIVEAVSATNLPSRKWANMYPIRVENKSSVIYHGSKLFYMYFETSSEKESWCKALRLASCDDKEKLTWFYKARAEFHSYLASLNVEYPSFLKPSIGLNPEIGDRSIKSDGSSKFRHILKKITTKASKTGREDKKFSENVVGGSSRHSQTEKKPNNGVEEKNIQAITAGTGPSGSRNLGSQSTDANSNDKVSSDDGTLCCSLLISRLFFDAKSNDNLRNSIQARIQRRLSAIIYPSYIGEIICTGVNPGIIPPHIHGMRIQPSDLKEVVAMDIDIEYYGGAVLYIETRLEVQELENRDSKPVDDVTTDILEEDTRSFKGNEQASSTVPKWKSLLNDIAKQVSQVPLSLAIRVTTLRGTLRVYIKPPPSDQIWFGFTSMPDIDFSLESSVGDHKITSGHIALYIINNLKAAIRETMVLPNSESLTIPFMIAEKNDWVPQKTAPFIWTNPESTTIEPAVIHEVHRSKSSTETTHDKATFNQPDDEKSSANDDEKTMLLESDDHAPLQVTSLPQSQSMVVATMEENNETAEGDDGKLRRSGTRAKMLGLRKKMGEKIEEKRRNIEEKGRHIVEKMRGPAAGGI